MLTEIFIAYLALTYLLTMLLGYLQVPSNSIPTETPSLAHPENTAHYSVLAVSAIGIQALATIVMLWGTGWFPLGALFVAFTLLSHHTIIHRYSRFEGESCACAPFQCKDVSNHETWVVAALVAGLVSLAGL
jgi:hypothetical protein